MWVCFNAVFECRCNKYFPFLLVSVMPLKRSVSSYCVVKNSFQVFLCMRRGNTARNGKVILNLSLAYCQLFQYHFWSCLGECGEVPGNKGTLYTCTLSKGCMSSCTRQDYGNYYDILSCMYSLQQRTFSIHTAIYRFISLTRQVCDNSYLNCTFSLRHRTFLLYISTDCRLSSDLTKQITLSWSKRLQQ